MKFFYENRRNRIEIEIKNGLAFGAHLHSQIELVYIVKGTAHAFAAGVDCRLNPGDFFIAFPNAIHYYDNCSSDIQTIITIASYDIFPEYRRELTALIPKNPKISGMPKEAAELFEKAARVKGEYQFQILHGYLSVILGMLFEKTQFEILENADNNTVMSIINYCRENYRENISLDIMSRDIHISKSRISHIFGEKLHISFRSFLNAFRLSEASELLLEGNLNITRIAMEVGFENVRTFNRAFLKHYGCSPFEYRKRGAGSEMIF